MDVDSRKSSQRSRGRGTRGGQRGGYQGKQTFGRSQRGDKRGQWTRGSSDMAMDANRARGSTRSRGRGRGGDNTSNKNWAGGNSGNFAGFGGDFDSGEGGQRFRNSDFSSQPFGQSGFPGDDGASGTHVRGRGSAFNKQRGGYSQRNTNEKKKWWANDDQNVESSDFQRRTTQWRGEKGRGRQTSHRGKRNEGDGAFGNDMAPESFGQARFGQEGMPDRPARTQSRGRGTAYSKQRGGFTQNDDNRQFSFGDSTDGNRSFSDQKRGTRGSRARFNQNSRGRGRGRGDRAARDRGRRTAQRPREHPQSEEEAPRQSWRASQRPPDTSSNKPISDGGRLIGTMQAMCSPEEIAERIEFGMYSPCERDPITEKADPDRMVKEYKRSSADKEKPTPELIRPVSVLEATLEYLMRDVLHREDIKYIEKYNFIRDRTRAIRTELTIQSEKGEAAARVTERIARFHILSDFILCEEEFDVFDPKQNDEQFSNCLISIFEFYEHVEKTENPSFLSSNQNRVEEMVANEILFRATTDQKEIPVLQLLQKLEKTTPELLKTSRVYQDSMELFINYIEGNYRAYFRKMEEIGQYNFLLACMAGRLAQRARIFGFITYLHAQRSGISVKYRELLNIFRFDTSEHLVKFLDMAIENFVVVEAEDGRVDENGDFLNSDGLLPGIIANTQDLRSFPRFSEKHIIGVPKNYYELVMGSYKDYTPPARPSNAGNFATMNGSPMLATRNEPVNPFAAQKRRPLQVSEPGYPARSVQPAAGDDIRLKLQTIACKTIQRVYRGHLLRKSPLLGDLRAIRAIQSTLEDAQRNYDMVLDNLQTGRYKMEDWGAVMLLIDDIVAKIAHEEKDVKRYQYRRGYREGGEVLRERTSWLLHGCENIRKHSYVVHIRLEERMAAVQASAIASNTISDGGAVGSGALGGSNGSIAMAGGRDTQFGQAGGFGGRGSFNSLSSPDDVPHKRQKRSAFTPIEQDIDVNRHSEGLADNATKLAQKYGRKWMARLEREREQEDARQRASDVSMVDKMLSQLGKGVSKSFRQPGEDITKKVDMEWLARPMGERSAPAPHLNGVGAQDGVEIPPRDPADDSLNAIGLEENFAEYLRIPSHPYKKKRRRKKGRDRDTHIEEQLDVQLDVQKRELELELELVGDPSIVHKERRFREIIAEEKRQGHEFGKYLDIMKNE